MLIYHRFAYARTKLSLKFILNMDRNALIFFMSWFNKHALAAHVGCLKLACGNGATLLAKPLYV